MGDTLTTIGYLVAAICFILGVKRLSGVKTAASGNRLAAVGMLLAVVVVLLHETGLDWRWVVAGLVVGGGIGAIMAVRVQMTGMPELVALFNGFGGAASAVVALSFVFTWWSGAGDTGLDLWAAKGASETVTLLASIIVGSLTFTGSLVAFLKLAGKMGGDPVLLPGRHVINALLGLGAVALCVWVGASALDATPLLIALLALCALALLLGWMLVIPIGGADMPVVISLLNSYSGVAAAMTGFVLHNSLLIIAGALVGASGLILTRIMCKAMNRSLGNVIFGGFGGEATGGKAQRAGYTKVKECGAEEACAILEAASSVIFVPGYGLAVAQAQHTIRELAELMESRGVQVRYAIHPVAGRMPGHMNVLLAEANVPYEQLVEMDDINPDFKNTDAVIVVGANDVVNPVARTDPGSPIYGMPILNVDEARTVFIIKRSLSPGFAGIDNPLFEADNALMVFGDAKGVLEDLVKEMKNA